MIDFNEEQLIAIAEKAKALGVEMFVMDDGWFGRRTDEYRGLGDWQCNLMKIPSGIAGLSKRIHKLGMKFGIWIEPERYQLVLDFTRDDVIDEIFNQLYAEFKDAKIDYIKWDMNRSMTERFSQQLPAERQGEVCHRYVLGVYKLMQRLTDAFPQIRIEGCCGGGGRFDMGMFPLIHGLHWHILGHLDMNWIPMS